jgi:penicillin-binding protein 2
MFALTDREFASPVRRRLFIVLIALVFIGFIIRFVQLQLLQGSELGGAANAQGIKKIIRIPVRGAIYDRNGKIIAASIPSYTVSLTPQDFLPYKEEALPLLAKILDVDTSYILNKIQLNAGYASFQPIKLWSDADTKLIAALEERAAELPGIDVYFESKRRYVAPIRASHILGYIKEISDKAIKRYAETDDSTYYRPGDLVGTSGLEAYHERELRGIKGYEYVAVDAKGQKQARFKEGKADVNAVDGASIQLGLDIDLQVYAEQLLDVHRGAIVAIDPNNGDILAFASKPDFDLDIFSGKTTKAEYQSVMLDPAHPLFNRATQTHYPPGSTWKMMMAAAGLQSKAIDFNFNIGCIGSFTLGNHTFKDDGVHGSVNIRKSIIVSCDVFYYRMVLMIGIDTMRKYARYFGFDTATGVDLAYEGNGFVPDTKRMNKLYPKGWTKGYTVSQGIGQGEVGVSPIQQAGYAAVWANHGEWVRPRAAKAIYNTSKGQWDPIPVYKRKVPIADTIINLLRSSMWGVVHEPGGTAHSAETPGLPCDIAGKTGTAQNPHGNDHAWFICFAPYDKPKIAMCVMLENAGFGGRMAAPLARKLVKYYLTGEREDPLPAVLPNTPEYQQLREMKYGKKKTPSLTSLSKPDSAARRSN